MRERLSLLALFVLAVLLRLYGIERESLWLDEIGQVVVAQDGWWQTITGAGEHAGSAPLDYVITHFSLRLGHSEGVLRLAPALWGALAVVLAYQVGRRAFDRSTGWAAALMLAITPIHVYYSREVRFYSLATLLALAVTWSFLWALERPAVRARWLLYGGVLCLGLYAHYYTAVIAGVQGVWLAVKTWRERLPRRVFWRFAAAAGGAGLLFLPWAVYDNWVLESAVGRSFTFPTLEYLLSAPFSHRLLFDSRRQEAWLIAAGLGCAASVIFIALDRRRAARAQRALLFLGTFAAGTAAALALDDLTGYFFAHRQLLMFTPFLLLAIAFGGVETFRALRARLPGAIAAWLPDGLAAAAMAGFMLLTLGPVLQSVYTVTQREDWRAVSRYLLQHAQPTDAIVAPCAMCVEYYSPELAPQIAPPGSALEAGAYERVWFFDAADLPAEVRATVDPAALDNRSPTYFFRLYVAALPDR